MSQEPLGMIIAGHRGLVGSAIVRELTHLGYTNLITRTHPSSTEAPAKTSPYANSPRLSAASSATRGSWSSTPPSPTAPPRKLMDVTRLHALGWHHTTPLEEGITCTWNQVIHQLTR